MADIDAPVTTPNNDRASDSHPVMYNPRNEARAAYRKKYGQPAPKGWPYTEAEVRLANKLVGLVEDGDAEETDEMRDAKSTLALKRL